MSRDLEAGTTEPGSRSMQVEDRDGEIAVVGMSCRLPGARTPAEYWSNLCQGVESISFFSEEELLAAGTPPELVRDPSFVRAYGAMPDAFAFDAAFFGVTPAEALVMDPQQRVFLESAWAALEDAGCAEQAVLEHCRKGGEHVRGCWVVDLLLGKG